MKWQLILGLFGLYNAVNKFNNKFLVRFTIYAKIYLKCATLLFKNPIDTLDNKLGRKGNQAKNAVDLLSTFGMH